MNNVFVYEGTEFTIDRNILRRRDGHSAEFMPVKVGRAWCVQNFWGEYRLGEHRTKADACAAIVKAGRVPVREFALSIKERALKPNGRPWKP